MVLRANLLEVRGGRRLVRSDHERRKALDVFTRRRAVRRRDRHEFVMELEEPRADVRFDDLLERRREPGSGEKAGPSRSRSAERREAHLRKVFENASTSHHGNLPPSRTGLGCPRLNAV